MASEHEGNITLAPLILGGRLVPGDICRVPSSVETRAPILELQRFSHHGVLTAHVRVSQSAGGNFVRTHPARAVCETCPVCPRLCRPCPAMSFCAFGTIPSQCAATCVGAPDHSEPHTPHATHRRPLPGATRQLRKRHLWASSYTQ